MVGFIVTGRTESSSVFDNDAWAPLGVDPIRPWRAAHREFLEEGMPS